LSISVRNPAAEVSTNAAIRWFCLIFAIATVFQVVRLMQDSPGSWLAMDYAMRIVALALLALSPVRAAVFRREPLRVTSEQLVASLLIAGVAIFLIVLVERNLWDILPDLSLGQYPRTIGWLHRFDLTFGIALVAIHEELVFRRLARLAFSRLGDGLAMIATTSLVFALYHWWTGPWNVLMVAVAGVVLMMLYRGVGALWPAIVIHYCVDLYAFW
jgi:uncharacterized protein